MRTGVSTVGVLACLLAAGGFLEAVTREKFEHIVSRKVVLREVSEEEVVVAKDRIADVTAEERRQIESDVLSLLGTAEPSTDAGKKRAASLRRRFKD